MFSKRFFSLFLLIVSFGVFVSAKPIDNHDVVIRGLGDVSQNDVTGLTRRQPCSMIQFFFKGPSNFKNNFTSLDCPQDLLNALNTLQEECNPLIDQLSTHT